ncbi:hypothetical protein [Aestuariirhabdus sp. LZHN29]|uniref:hypothetical protein n=1 Tax=Aestuariirhabdus sp. LZHN29 TaxID=3417462 RepID=UPI003CECB553
MDHIEARHMDGLNLSAAEVVAALETMLHQKIRGGAWSAPKSTLLPGDGRYLMSTLAACDDPALMAVKSLVVNPHNPAQGLAGINAIVTLQHGQTGVPLATLDGNWITAVRTAGLSALVARYLAPATASEIGFIGCGVQARSHLQVLAQLYPLRRVRAFGRGARNLSLLSEHCAELGLGFEACPEPEAVVRSADLLVSSVTLDVGMKPFLDARWLKPGSYAAITDLGLPWYGDSLQSLSTLVIDDLEQEAAMERPLANPAWVSGDLAALVTGGVSAAPAAGASAFVFRGLALADLALSALVWKRVSGT